MRCEQAIWSREEGWSESFQDPYIAAAARVYRRSAKMVRKPAEEAEERSEAEAQGGRHPRTEQVPWWALMRVRLLGVQPETWARARKRDPQGFHSLRKLDTREGWLHRHTPHVGSSGSLTICFQVRVAPWVSKGES